jgi:hypothetical protein
VVGIFLRVGCNGVMWGRISGGGHDRGGVIVVVGVLDGCGYD